jgi:hypothetical protein
MTAPKNNLNEAMTAIFAPSNGGASRGPGPNNASTGPNRPPSAPGTSKFSFPPTGSGSPVLGNQFGSGAGPVSTGQNQQTDAWVFQVSAEFHY